MLCCGSIGIAQRIPRLADRVLNLSADIALGVNQQLCCGEQHLDLTDPGHLTDRGFHLAGAGGAAHLPGMIAAKTLVPVLGVPVQSAALSGVDSLYSIVQMPRGIPVGTLAIGKAGAANAALLAAQILATHDKELHQRLNDWRKAQTDEVLENPDPRGAA